MSEKYVQSRMKTPFCWQHKPNLRFLRKAAKDGRIRRVDARNCIDTYRAITEFTSDQMDGASEFVAEGLARRLAGYAMMSPDTVFKALYTLKDLGLIRYEIRRDDKQRVTGTFIELINLDEPKAQTTSESGKPDLGKRDSGTLQALPESEKPDSAKPDSGKAELGKPTSEEELDVEEELGVEEGLGSADTEPIKSEDDLTPKQRLERDVRTVIDYLNQQCGRSFTYEGGQAKYIRARLRDDGANVDDCQTIIDHKKEEWFGNSEMHEYLRPKTLFSKEHFEDYLDQAKNLKVNENGKTQADVERLKQTYLDCARQWKQLRESDPDRAEKLKRDGTEVAVQLENHGVDVQALKQEAGLG